MEFGNPLFNIAIFLAFVVITLVVVIRVSKQNVTAGDFYHGGRAFSGRQNGIAIAGDYLSASSSPGWWRCCWSPSRCATPRSTRWPTC